jgi:hypothetical protein
VTWTASRSWSLLGSGSPRSISTPSRCRVSSGWRQREGYTITSFAYEHLDVDVFGDTGVIHARYSQVASWDQNNLSNVFRLTDVWSRRDGKWQVVARHSSILG